jgi:hypothetical protein
MAAASLQKVSHKDSHASKNVTLNILGASMGVIVMKI